MISYTLKRQEGPALYVPTAEFVKLLNCEEDATLTIDLVKNGNLIGELRVFTYCDEPDKVYLQCSWRYSWLKWLKVACGNIWASFGAEKREYD